MIGLRHETGPARSRTYSIRRRLTLLLIAGLAGTVLAGGGLLYPAVRQILVTQFDQTQLSKLRALTTLPEPGRHGINLAFTQRVLSEFQRTENPEYFQVWLPDGSVALSPSLGTNHLEQRVGSESSPEFWNLTLPDGRPGRAVGIGFGREASPSANSPANRAAPHPPRYTASVVLASDTTRLHQLLSRLLAGLGLGGALLAGVMGWIVHAGTRTGLLPIHELSEQVRSIDARSLRSRLASQTAPLELQTIIEQLNQLMDRLESAFERERRFAANAAHELLTPVAELRSSAEAAQAWSDDPEAIGSFASDTLETARQMEHIVSSLLSLARAESSPADVNWGTIHLSELLEELRPGLLDRIHSRKLSLRWKIHGGIRVKTDRRLCRSICLNLFDNALTHTPAGGEIEAALEESTSEVVLSISNTSEPLTEDDLSHVFEPFWRKDNVRSTRDHAGLGLAVARAFARALQLELTAASPAPRVFEVRLRFPYLEVNTLVALPR